MNGCRVGVPGTLPACSESRWVLGRMLMGGGFVIKKSAERVMDVGELSVML